MTWQGITQSTNQWVDCVAQGKAFYRSHHHVYTHWRTHVRMLLLAAFLAPAEGVHPAVR